MGSNIQKEGVNLSFGRNEVRQKADFRLVSGSEHNEHDQMTRLGLLFAFLLTTCTDPTAAPDLLDWQYFPVDRDRYWEFEETETVYTNAAAVTTQRWVRWEMADVRVSAAGSSFVIFEFTRVNEAAEWEPRATFSGLRAPERLTWFESSVPVVKLSFPITPASPWNAHAFNSLGGPDRCGTSPCDYYEVTARDVPHEVLGRLYEQSITVVQQHDTDLIVGNDVRKEWYARAVGLIERRLETVTYCTQPACLGQQQIESGRVVSLKLRAYGS